MCRKKKGGFKQKSDHFCFSQQCKYFGSGKIGFHFFFFFFNRPVLQIVELEKILHVESEPGKFSPELQALSVFMVRWEANWLCRRPFPAVTRAARGLSAPPGCDSFTLAGWLAEENERGRNNAWVGRQVRSLYSESPRGARVQKSASATSGKHRLTFRPDALANTGPSGIRVMFR